MKKIQWQSDVTKKENKIYLLRLKRNGKQDKLPHKQCKFEGVVTTCDAKILLQVMMQINKKIVIHFTDVNQQ